MIAVMAFAGGALVGAGVDSGSRTDGAAREPAVSDANVRLRPLAEILAGAHTRHDDSIDRLRKLAAKLADSPQYAVQQAWSRCPGDDDTSARGRLAYESGVLGQRCRSAADEIALIIRLLETP